MGESKYVTGGGDELCRPIWLAKGATTSLFSMKRADGGEGCCGGAQGKGGGDARGLGAVKQGVSYSK